MNLEMFVRFAIKRKLKNLGENFGDDKFDKFQYVEQFESGVIVLTSEEKLRRALAVETMHRLYKKYYPIWVKQQK